MRKKRSVARIRAMVARTALCLLGIVLCTIVVACREPPAATERWVPPYLRLRLCGGEAQVQQADAAGLTKISHNGELTVDEMVQVVADALEGSLFCIGDGSTIKLSPESVAVARNPRTHPRLQIVLQSGELLLVAHETSYELSVMGYAITLINAPTRIRIEATDEIATLWIEQGAATCTVEDEVINLPTGRQMIIRSGQAPQISDAFTAPSDATSTAAPAPAEGGAGAAAGSTRGSTERETPAASPTSTPTPSPTPEPTLETEEAPPPFPTAVPPTDTPVPPPSKPKSEPKPTDPPPPPPTNPPPPPPTDPPPPPPTDPPPPPPTDPPQRPTPAPQRDPPTEEPGD